MLLFSVPFIITLVKETKNINERRKQPWLGGPLGYYISNLEDLYRDQLQRQGTTAKSELNSLLSSVKTFGMHDYVPMAEGLHGTSKHSLAPAVKNRMACFIQFHNQAM